MSAQLHLAGPEDGDRLLAMIARCHADAGRDMSEEHRSRAVLPLLEGHPLGAIYLIGPRRSPVGYIAVSFGWSIARGGIDGFVDEFWIRPSVRGRGIGTEALHKLLPALAAAGVRVMQIETRHNESGAQKLYARAGFSVREGYLLMAKDLKQTTR